MSSLSKHNKAHQSVVLFRNDGREENKIEIVTFSDALDLLMITIDKVKVTFLS